MSNVLFLRRSLAFRHAALETARQARAMAPGAQRRATRQLFRALIDLARTEAWLEGQTPRRYRPADGAELSRRAVG